MRRSLAAAAAVLTPLVSGCFSLTHEHVEGTGDVVTAARSLGAFDRVVVLGSPHRVEVRVGLQRSVTVTAQKNVAELIETTVSANTLNIDDHKPYRSSKEVLVRVTAPSLAAFAIHGSSDASITGARGPALDLSIAGAGNIGASGAVDRMTLECSGAGNADLKGLQVRDAVVHLSGVGNASIAVSHTLDVTIAGVGSVTYRGSPRIVHRSIMGVGSLTQE